MLNEPELFLPPAPHSCAEAAASRPRATRRGGAHAAPSAPPLLLGQASLAPESWRTGHSCRPGLVSWSCCHHYHALGHKSTETCALVCPGSEVKVSAAWLKGSWRPQRGLRPTLPSPRPLFGPQPRKGLQSSSLCMCLVLKMPRSRLPTQHVCRGPGQKSQNARIHQTRSPVSLQQEMRQTVAWPGLVLGGNDTQ